MKALLHKNFFTLVEVLLAMSICVVGLCSVVVFFPIGANASRNASMASYAANVAEQILDYAKICIESDIGEEVSIGGIDLDEVAFRYFTSPTGLCKYEYYYTESGELKKKSNDKWQGWTPNDPSTYNDDNSVVTTGEVSYTSLIGDLASEKKDELMEVIKSSQAKEEGKTVFGQSMTNSIQTILSTVTSDEFPKVTAEIIPYRNNVFKVRFVSRGKKTSEKNKKSTTDEYDEELADSVYSDFDCFASLWATPVYADYARSFKIPYAMRLHVTISWPADLPFDSRQKRDFSMDIFKSY